MLLYLFDIVSILIEFFWLFAISNDVSSLTARQIKALFCTPFMYYVNKQDYNAITGDTTVDDYKVDFVFHCQTNSISNKSGRF